MRYRESLEPSRCFKQIVQRCEVGGREVIRVRMEVQGREQSEQRVQGTPESGVGAQPVERNAVLPPNPAPPFVLLYL